MNNDQPDIYEVERLVKFCKKYVKIFVINENDSAFNKLEKYFNMIGINVSGTIQEKDFLNDNLKLTKNDGIIFCGVDKNITKYKNLKKKRNVFWLTQFSTRNICYKMTPRSKENFWLEVNLADHCNLNCQMCDHFSPIADPTFMNLNTFEKDMSRLADLMQHEMGIIKLQGGEPLLNPNVVEYMRISRELFPESIIWLFTDGILLLNEKSYGSDDFWMELHKYNIEIQLTVYPIKINLDKIMEKAKKFDVKVTAFYEVGDRSKKEEKRSVKHPMKIEKNCESYQFVGCYQFNESIALNNGKIYTCPMIPYIKHLNKYFETQFEVTQNDYIDIYSANSYEEIAEFCTTRIPFCGYCFVKGRRSYKWKQSKHNKDEWLINKKDELYAWLMYMGRRTGLYNLSWLRKLMRRFL